MNPALKEKLSVYKSRLETGIDELLPSVNERPSRLHAAMRYSMQASGKRLRPALLFLASELFPIKTDPVPAAVAIECLHTYTLIHDDLPAIDNSDLRRGRPACHTQFDEATALLAGDGLLTFAFQLIIRQYRSAPALATDLVGILAEASGSERLIGGQMEDIENEGRPVDAATLLFIHENKTAALLTAALEMGLRFGEPSSEQVEQVRKIGYHLGMAFQIIDDILDATSDAKTMGKPVGNDAAVDKLTYVALHGIEGAQSEAERQTKLALEKTAALGGQNGDLIALIESMAHRVH